MKKLHITMMPTLLINLSLFLFIAIMATVLPNTYEALKYIGFITITFSVYVLWRYRTSGLLIWIVGIISLINICWSSSVCLSPIENSYNWQIPLINIQQNIIMAKSVMLFYPAMIVGFGNKDTITNNFNIKTVNKKNNIIVIGGSIVLLLILIFGFSRDIMSVGTYTSQINPFYEYAIVVFIFTWCYSGSGKTISKLFLCIYAMAYIFQGLFFGDRSSAFPMILILIILIYKKEIKMKHILFFGVSGIVLANIIDLTRNGIFNMSLGTILSRGLNLNTISYSHYAGVQIIRASYDEYHLSHMFDYIVGFFKGGNGTLATFAKLEGFHNSGGGFTISYFYYWLGIIGVAAGGYILGKIIVKIFMSENQYLFGIKLSIVAFTIRWYLYFPTSFFRSAVIVPFVVYYLCCTVEDISKYKKIIIKKKD